MTDVPGVAGRGDARPVPAPTPAIELLEVSRAFGALLALARVSLSITPAEFFASSVS